jgi:HD-GYP domain-containing protein (c-di-GMP phosphodiesterase class II)
MIYAIKLGIGLGYPRPRLVELGLSALMHDVGMFRIPESIALKSGKLTEREIEIIKTHAEIGRDIMNPLSSSYPSLTAVAYEHHEREGGQGYPRGLKGNEIHEFARIIGLADSYEAMTHNRPYRKALMQSFSAKELIKSKSALFSQVVIKVFLKEISLYPLGSFVILNNKSIGEVVATDYNHPLRPTVKMLYDGEGKRVQDDVMIKLNENPLFFIVDGVSPEEVPVHR